MPETELLGTAPTPTHAETSCLGLSSWPQPPPCPHTRRGACLLLHVRLLDGVAQLLQSHLVHGQLRSLARRGQTACATWTGGLFWLRGGAERYLMTWSLPPLSSPSHPASYREAWLPDNRRVPASLSPAHLACKVWRCVADRPPPTTAITPPPFMPTLLASWRTSDSSSSSALLGPAGGAGCTAVAAFGRVVAVVAKAASEQSIPERGLRVPALPSA